MKIAFIIGLGGFVGSISRYMVHQALYRLFPVAFPWGTFTVNITGSLLLGIILALTEHYKILTTEWRVFLTIGFCGSFTTYSTFALEGFTLLQQKEYLIFGLYIFASLILGILFAAAGYFLFTK
ncbi:MAG: fluoride efflux transporter CrcB [Candidatus Cyclobacteriaceae bacterium M2_1C_046]